MADHVRHMTYMIGIEMSCKILLLDSSTHLNHLKYQDRHYMYTLVRFINVLLWSERVGQSIITDHVRHRSCTSHDVHDRH